MKSISLCLILLCFALLPLSCNTNKHTSISDTDVIKSEIFSDPYQMPYYLNGGDAGLQNDLYSTMSKTAPITQECVKGRAVISFTISEDGVIDPNSIKLIRNWSVPGDYIDAAIQAIKSLGKFEPGKFNNTPKKVRYSIPIIYPIPLDRIKTSE